MSIAILCPTRGRAQLCKRMIDSIDATAHGGVQVYIAQDHDDGDAYEKELKDYKVNLFSFPMYPTAYKWEKLAHMAFKDPTIKFFMLGSDDMYFDTDGWDEALRTHYSMLEDKRHVYSLQDTRDANGTPHPIVTREYIEFMGYFCPPCFLHWYIDGWTVEIAKYGDCFTHMRDFVLVHDKPSDRGQADDTHNRIRNWGWKERDEYTNSVMQPYLQHEKRRFRK